MSADISDELWEQRREAGPAGGKIGGKRCLVKAKRVHLAYIAGLQGGAPITRRSGRSEAKA